MIKKLYKRLVSLHWEIGVLDNSLEGIVNGEPLSFKLINHKYKDSWFADPFILDVNEKYIIFLVEEVTTKQRKGVISKLVVDKDTLCVVEKKKVLECSGHLSFPIIYRKGNNIFIYPENSADGALKLYKYNVETDAVVLETVLCDQPLTDAVYTELFGERLLFTTDTRSPNGNNLDLYEWDEDIHKFIFQKSFYFNEHIARMAGDFFKIGGNIYRPAQESNTNYGHAISIQSVSYDISGWRFTEVRRIVSPHKVLSHSCHTLNTYKGVVVVDVLGYRYPKIAKLIDWTTTLIKNFIK